MRFDGVARAEGEAFPGVDHLDADVLAENDFDADPARCTSVDDAIGDQLADQEPKISDRTVIETGRGRLAGEPPSLGRGAGIHRKGPAHD